MIDQYIRHLEASQRRAVYTNQLEFLKVEFVQRCTFVWQGHRFVVDTGLLAWIDRLAQECQTRGENAGVLLDQNTEPVLVNDVEEFREQAYAMYYEALNHYYDQYAKLKSASSLSEIVGAV